MNPVEDKSPMSMMSESGVAATDTGKLYANTAICIGLMALCGVMICYLMYRSYQPASVEKVMRFREVFPIALTQDQTTRYFIAKDPVTHELQQRVVDRVLRDKVAEAYGLGQTIQKFQWQREALIHRDQTGDESIAKARPDIDILESRISAVKTERDKIEQLWADWKQRALDCNFSSKGVIYFSDAMGVYKKWLQEQNQGPPQKLGAAVLFAYKQING